MTTNKSLETKIVQTSAGEVEYIDQGKGKPILFVHGSPGGCDQSILMSNFLIKKGFRIIAPSRSGYLNTRISDSNKTPKQQADLHIALMDQLKIDTFSAMCWSGGGPSTYLLAAKYPKRVKNIVACAAVSKAYKFKGGVENSLMYGNIGKWLLAEMAKHSPKSLIKSTLAEEGDLSKLQVKDLTRQIWQDPIKRDFVVNLSATLAGRKAGLNNDHKQFPQITDLELSKIACPVLLVHGTVDSDVPLDNSDFAHKKIANSEFVKIIDGTHLAVWTDPSSDNVQKQIIEFIA